MRMFLLALTFMAICSEPVAGAEAAKPKPYPLTTCIVSGDTFGGDMGDPIVKVYGDREIKLCCKGCIKKFEADQPGYIKKIDEAAAKAAKAVPAAPAAPVTPKDDHHGHNH